jgi:hypothetical protein
MGVHLDESKTTISLEASLNHVPEVGEKWDKVILGGIWGEVANIASGLPRWGLLDNHIVTLDTVGWEVMVSEWGGWGHAARHHSLLLRYRWLALLIGPVAADGTRTKPFAIHGAQSLLGILTLTECNESIAPGAACLHVPHDSGLRNRAECGESLKEDLIVDLVGQIADENVEMV